MGVARPSYPSLTQQVANKQASMNYTTPPQPFRGFTPSTPSAPNHAYNHWIGQHINSRAHALARSHIEARSTKRRAEESPVRNQGTKRAREGDYRLRNQSSEVANPPSAIDPITQQPTSRSAQVVPSHSTEVPLPPTHAIAGPLPPVSQRRQQLSTPYASRQTRPNSSEVSRVGPTRAYSSEVDTELSTEIRRKEDFGKTIGAATFSVDHVQGIISFLDGIGNSDSQQEIMRTLKAAISEREKPANANTVEVDKEQAPHGEAGVQEGGASQQRVQPSSDSLEVARSGVPSVGSGAGSTGEAESEDGSRKTTDSKGRTISLTKADMVRKGLYLKRTPEERRMKIVNSLAVFFCSGYDEKGKAMTGLQCWKYETTECLFRQQVANITRYREHLIRHKCGLSSTKLKQIRSEGCERNKKVPSIGVSYHSDEIIAGTIDVKALDNSGPMDGSDDEHEVQIRGHILQATKPDTPGLQKIKKSSLLKPRRGETKSVQSGSSSRKANSQEESKKKKNQTLALYERFPNAKDICTLDQAVSIQKGIMHMLVTRGYPFSAFDKKGNVDSSETEVLRAAKPAFVEHFLPNSYYLGGVYLVDFHRKILKDVNESMDKALRNGYGTLVFDGWEDNKKRSVFNVLLKTESHIDSNRKIFFLKSLFTDHKSMTAVRYQSEVEGIMKEFGGHRNICAITTDNTSACVNARKIYQRKYAGIVSVGDQPHIVDLAMKDIGKIQWIKDAIKSVATISTELHKYPKLLSLYRQLTKVENETIRKVNEHSRKLSRSSSRRSSQGDHFPKRNMMRRDSELSGSSQIAANNLNANSNSDSNIDGNSDNTVDGSGYLAFETVIMLKKVCATRFANAESVLDSYVRGVKVLRRLVVHDEFEILYKYRGAEKEVKKAKFVDPINDEEFLLEVKAILQVLRIIRNYLRFFDRDNAQICDVLRLTKETLFRIDMLSDESDNKGCLSIERKVEIHKKFVQRRDKTGSGQQIGLLDDVHFAAHLLNPCTFTEDDYNERTSEFKRHIRAYLDGEGVSEADKQDKLVTIELAFLDVISGWDNERSKAKSSNRPDPLLRFDGKALQWWQTMFETDGDDKKKLLKVFAMSTLSCSPTASFVDRSFKDQMQISTKLRNRLLKKKVAMLMFCKWNLRILRGKTIIRKETFARSLLRTGNIIKEYETAQEELEDARIGNEHLTEGQLRATLEPNENIDSDEEEEVYRYRADHLYSRGRGQHDTYDEDDDLVVVPGEQDESDDSEWDRED